jgi:GNAT superfamily N-acetyltransferase
MTLLSPEGRPLTIRPIERGDLGRVLLRCLPDGGSIERLFVTQGTVGMAAWEGERCVAQLHGYRLLLPGGDNPYWPQWSRPWWAPLALEGRLSVRGAVWCHACFHVGRTIEGLARSDEPDTRYSGRGIGTALCRASVAWAQARGYLAVLGTGAPAGLFQFALWAGSLPWTAYKRLGFRSVALETDSETLPRWAQGDSPPEVMAEVQATIQSGRPPSELRTRLMVLDTRPVA